jgi:hypothetical protein
LSLDPRFAGSNPAKDNGFLTPKNPQHAFLRMGSKHVGAYDILKIPSEYDEKYFAGKTNGYFSTSFTLLRY